MVRAAGSVQGYNRVHGQVSRLTLVDNGQAEQGARQEPEPPMSQRHETPTAIDRRNFLRGATLASLPLAFCPFALAGAVRRGEKPLPAGLIPRQKNPENLEFPFSTLDRFLTPNDLFYVRNHFPAPEMDASSWRLKVEGAVERPLALS